VAINIYDKNEQHYVVGDMIDHAFINQPLVTERREKFSFPFGDAELVQIAFSGICIVYGDVLVKENRLRIRSFDEHDQVELHFSLRGDGKIENFITRKKHVIKSNQHKIFYSPNFDGIAELATYTQNKFFEIHFNREKFVDLTSDTSTLLKRFGDNVMNGRPVELAPQNLSISLAMHSCINDIMHCDFTGGLKLLFLQSKCIELLALQAKAFITAAGDTGKAAIKSDYDRERIYFAREYLIKNMTNPPSLTQLAQAAGINEFKLKQGFKETFKHTVFGYLSDYKLMLAKDLLSDKTKDIKHIAHELGYSSVQHFSTAFAKKFGVSPGKSR